VTLEFSSEGRVSGSACCNRITGTYRRDGATITLGQMATTKMMCPPERMVVEYAVIKALAKPGTIVGDAVTFADGAGLALRFE
jgi:heat shock protein HslJ